MGDRFVVLPFIACLSRRFRADATRSGPSGRERMGSLRKQSAASSTDVALTRSAQHYPSTFHYRRPPDHWQLTLEHSMSSHLVKVFPAEFVASHSIGRTRWSSPEESEEIRVGRSVRKWIDIRQDIFDQSKECSPTSARRRGWPGVERRSITRPIVLLEHRLTVLPENCGF